MKFPPTSTGVHHDECPHPTRSSVPCQAQTTGPDHLRPGVHADNVKRIHFTRHSPWIRVTTVTPSIHPVTLRDAMEIGHILATCTCECCPETTSSTACTRFPCMLSRNNVLYYPRTSPRNHKVRELKGPRHRYTIPCSRHSYLSSDL